MTPVILYEEQPCRRRCRFLCYVPEGRVRSQGGIRERRFHFNFDRRASKHLEILAMEWTLSEMLNCSHKRVSSQWGKMIRWNLVLVGARLGGSYNTEKFSGLIWQKFSFLLTLPIQCGAQGIFLHYGSLMSQWWEHRHPDHHKSGKGKAPLKPLHWWHDPSSYFTGQSMSHQHNYLKGLCSENRKPEIFRE